MVVVTIMVVLRRRRPETLRRGRRLARAMLCGVLLGLAVVVPTAPASAHRAPPTPTARAAGYHHMGATTVGTWAGVSGRLTVSDPGVRPGTFDFVAARFMARSADGTTWLEAGWAENGWLRDGKQRVYTYDTARKRWTFYNEYPISPGDHVWIYVETTRGGNKGTHWSAWLWWEDKWRLLVNQALPIGVAATIEEYVEVYVDPSVGGAIALPAAGFDNVQLKDRNGKTQFWREPDVPTGAGTGFANYCLTWIRRFDTWSAATCTSPARSQTAVTPRQRRSADPPRRS